MANGPKKVALAYSGGLDTSIIIPWLRENYGTEVVAVCGDVGQGVSELDGLEQKALDSGACEVHVADLREEFVRDYVWPMVRAGAVYEHKYLLGTSIARPLLAKLQVEVALRTGCDALAHGATGKGNDQVRFELAYKALAPHLAVIAPWREWDILSREDAVDYASQHGIPIQQSKKSIYSRDANLWHISHEGAELEDPANAPSDRVWTLSRDPASAPAEGAEVEIEFDAGTPVSLGGKRLSPAAMVEALNDAGCEHGIGRIDLVENLTFAHRELEALTLDRATQHYKQKVALDYAELVYDGKWFTPLREALDGFVERTQRHVTGTVRLRLCQGRIDVMGRVSPWSLYSPDIASFTMGDEYDQRDAAGLINLTGLPIRVYATVQGGLSEGTGGDQ